MLNTKYITLDEICEYYPNCDLRESMGEREAIALVKRQEDFIEAYVDSNFNKSIERTYPTFTEFQKEKYKLALIEQVYYVFENGEISNDSGYDLDKGVIAQNLSSKAIAPKTILHLRECGIWNRQIAQNRRFGGFIR